MMPLSLPSMVRTVRVTACATRTWQARTQGTRAWAVLWAACSSRRCISCSAVGDTGAVDAAAAAAAMLCQPK